jgi:diadenosine tetraphosphate (Ap4A) HIT family hydrolase
MTLVMPKHHFDSDVFNLDEDSYAKYLLAVKKVQAILKK